MAVGNTQKERTLLEGIIYYLKILLSYKWLILIVTGVAGLLVFGFVFITGALPPDKSPLPDYYQANAHLLLKESDELDVKTLLAALGNPSIRSTSIGSDNGRLAVRIIYTRTFLDKLIEEFKIPEKYGLVGGSKSQFRSLLQGKIELSYDRTVQILTISYVDIDPKFAKDIVNRIINLLQDWFSKEGGISKLNQKKQLEDKLKEVSAEITNLESKILEFQKKYGMISMEEQSNTQTDLLADLRSQLILKEMEIKNYSEFSLIEDQNLLRLKSERDNILELIDQVSRGFTGFSKNVPSKEKMPVLSQEFTHLNIDLKIQRKIYESLSQQYEVTKLTLNSEPVFQVLEWAEEPEEEAGPLRTFYVLVGTLVGFIVSATLAFLHNALKSIRQRE